MFDLFFYLYKAQTLSIDEERHSAALGKDINEKYSVYFCSYGTFRRILHHW